MIFVFTTEDDQYGREKIVSASSSLIEALEVYNKDIADVSKGLNSLTVFENGRPKFYALYLSSKGETYESVMSKIKEK